MIGYLNLRKGSNTYRPLKCFIFVQIWRPTVLSQADRLKRLTRRSACSVDYAA